MRYFSQHSYVRILGSGCAIFVLLASAYVTIHFSQARATSSLPIVNKPVIFLHGINQDGSADCSDWARAMIVLAQSTKISFTGPLVRLGYYSKDKNCSQNLSQISSPNCIGYDGTLKKAVGTTNESIRHIACELAWYLYNQYTQNGISVDMVTHSMGGLITRYALSEVEHGAKSFPSMLYVSNVIDLDTPNGGLPVDWYDKGIVNDVLCKNCLQAVQMQPGNPFILELYYFAQDPQIKGSVTTWTLLSSIINISCLNKRTNTVFAIPLPSPLDMNGKHIVKVVYKQPYYCHNGIFSMQEAAVPNQPTQVQYCDGCAKQDAKNWQQWKSSSTFPDPLYEMLRVLSAQASSPTPTPTLSPTLTPTPTLSPTLTPSPTPSSGSCPLPHPIVSSGLTVYTEGNNFLQALDANSGQLRWCYPLPVNGGSLVVANGIVYVIHNSSDSTSSILYALRAFDGLLLWNRNFSGGADNHLVVVNNVLYDGIGPSIYALNPTTGAQLWQFQTQGHSALDVTVANGVAYADVWGQYTSSNNYVYALNANDGSLLWSNNIGIMSPRILAITPSVIYINTSDYNSGSLDAMSTTSGKMIWTNPNSGGDTVINGVIYGGGNNGISALDATNGSTLWQTQQSDFTHLWVSNGVIYGVAQPGNSSTTTSVFTLNATNGAVLWQTPLNFYSFPSQIEVVNGIVYINDTGATMYALQAATGAVLWKTQVPPYISQDFVVTNGLVYVGSLDTGYVTALNASNGSLAWQYQGGTGVGAVG